MNDAIYTVYTGNNVGLTSKVISFYFKDGATIADAVMWLTAECISQQKELTQDVEAELLPYVLHEMKNMGFEFIENNEFWRL